MLELIRLKIEVDILGVLILMVQYTLICVVVMLCLRQALMAMITLFERVVEIMR